MKIELKVEVDAKDLAFDTKTLYRLVQDEIRSSSLFAKGIAQDLAPIDTGELRNSIYWGGSRLTWWAKTQVYHSEFMEEGTNPHVIVGNPMLMSAPGHKNPLEHPTHMVNHPGTPAYKYMETGLLVATEGIEDRILKAMTAGW